MVRNVNNGTLKNDYFILQACLWFDELLEWIKRKTDNNWVIKVAYIKYKFPCGFEVIAKGLFNTKYYVLIIIEILIFQMYYEIEAWIYAIYKKWDNFKED